MFYLFFGREARGAGENGDSGSSTSTKNGGSRKRENLEIAPPTFCTSSVVNMTCKVQFPGQRLLCYKEKWTIDGTTSKLIK